MPSERTQRRIDTLLDQAEDAITSLDWQVVHDRSEAALALDPSNVDAADFLAAANRAVGETSSAARTVQGSTSPEPPPQAAPAPEAERRQLTVMFCDLQGSTALSQQLDPEDLRDVIRGYQQVCAGAVGRFEGHIAKYLGDGLLVYFGYPQAHEDDPQRAVRAGLAILEDMEPLNAQLKSDKDLELTVRIGIHTGLVVAGEMGAGDTLEELAIVGETPNIAARIEGAALPNSVVVSNITANLVQGFFIYETLGPHELKGIAEPVELFRVLSESGAQTRFDVAVSAQLTPLVGREQELGLLLDRWEQVEEGLGQVVLISGEAGIGKSRLIDALGERLAEKAHTRWQLRCSAYHQTSTLHPLKEFLEIRLGFERDDSSEEKRAKLEDVLATADEAPLLASILSLPVDGLYPPLQLSPEGQKERTKEILSKLLIETDNQQPVLLIVEDLHWADPTTLEFMSFLVDQAPTTKLLAMFSFRPEYVQPWGSRAHLSQITLNRLPRRLANDMLAALKGGKEFPEEIVTQITTKSNGVPLFVEELTRMVIESGLVLEVDGRYVLSGPLTELAIPSTLQDSLTARLDRLSSVRESIQLAAVLGREFNHELIRAVSPVDDATLVQHLEQLVTGEFLHQRGVPPDADYMFKHALIQDAAYNSLLISRRQQYHQQTAAALKDHFPDTADAQPELLAHHYFEAGLTSEAVSYWLQAGDQSLSRYAWREALSNYQKALSAKGVEISGADSAEDAETAALLFGLGRAHGATTSRRELPAAYRYLSRAFEFYASTGDAAGAARIAEYPLPSLPGGQNAGDLLPRALKLVPNDSPEAGRLLSRHGLVIGIEGGDFLQASEAFDNALAIARRTGDKALETQTLSQYSMLNYWNLEPKESAANGLRAIKLARLTGDLLSEVNARFWTGVSLLQMGDSEDAQEQQTEILTTAESLRNDYRLSSSYWFNEIACLYQGDWQTAISFNERGLFAAESDARLYGTRMLLEAQIGNLIDGQKHLDQLVKALRSVAPAPSYDYAAVALMIPMVARTTGWVDQLPVAESAAATILSAPNASPFVSMFARLGLGLMAVLSDNVEAAKEQYSRIGTSAGSYMFISCDRVLGLLAGTMGDREQAMAHFEDAMNLCREAGYRPELAWACCDYADMLLDRNEEGDCTKAASLLHESLAISTELEMRPLKERVSVRRESLGQ